MRIREQVDELIARLGGPRSGAMWLLLLALMLRLRKQAAAAAGSSSLLSGILGSSVSGVVLRWGVALAAFASGAKAPTMKQSVPRLPWVGHTHLLPKMIEAGPPKYLLEVAKSRGFRSFELNTLGGDIVVLLAESEIRHVLYDNFKNYPKNADDLNGTFTIFEELLGDGIFASDDAQWLTHRKVASHLFSGRALKTKMEAVFVQHGRALAEVLEAAAESGEEVDMQVLFASLTFDTMCEIAFGCDAGALQSAAKGLKCDFLVSFDMAQQITSERLLQPHPYVFMAQRALKVGKEGALPGHIRVCDEFILKIVKARRAEIAASKGVSPRGDLLSLFIQHAHEKGKEHMLTDTYLRNMIINFMIAGRDTTSCALTNLFKMLPTCPGAEDRLVAECAQAAAVAAASAQRASAQRPAQGSSSEGFFDVVTRQMPFVDACFNESLRMFPPVGTDLRFAKDQDVMPTGVEIPHAGTMVMIPLYAIGRNPALFEEPDAFRPDRWTAAPPPPSSPASTTPASITTSGSDSSRRTAASTAASTAATKAAKLGPTKPIHRTHEYSMPVFWGGPRLCLGKDMARLEAKTITSLVAPRFQVVPRPGLPDDDFVVGPVIFHRAGLPCRIYKR